MIRAILFDLDGTLLPMDQEHFVKTYLKYLAGYLASYGYDPEKVVEAVWKGTIAMASNDGSRKNEEVFWTAFSGILGERVLAERPVLEQFYREDFQNVRSSCGYDPRSAETVRAIRAAGYRTILATNPVFPAPATESRIRWAGLEPEDFELYTTYENTSFCKPKLEYYREILRLCRLRAEDCLMVGNDAGEDMVTEKLGMRVFLMTDCLIDRGLDVSRYPQGSFAELLEFLGL